MSEVWGLTGGIASGKSEVARVFAANGIPVIDADLLSRELSSPGGLAHAAIVSRFGTADRTELRKLVFGDVAARQDLEGILHPLIEAESLRRIQAAGTTHVVYEAALLVETGRYKLLSGLIVVDAPSALRRERLITRDGIAPELADRILAAQVRDADRLAAATTVIPNRGTLVELRAAVEAWIARKGWK